MAEHVSITLDTARFSARLAQFEAATRDAEQVVFEVAAKVLGEPRRARRRRVLALMAGNMS